LLNKNKDMVQKRNSIPNPLLNPKVTEKYW